MTLAAVSGLAGQHRISTFIFKAYCWDLSSFWMLLASAWVYFCGSHFWDRDSVIQNVLSPGWSVGLTGIDGSKVAYETCGDQTVSTVPRVWKPNDFWTWTWNHWVDRWTITSIGTASQVFSGAKHGLATVDHLSLGIFGDFNFDPYHPYPSWPSLCVAVAEKRDLDTCCAEPKACIYTDRFMKTGSMCVYISGWWFGTFFIFPNSWDDHPIWLIFFRGVETTNQICIQYYTMTCS